MMNQESNKRHGRVPEYENEQRRLVDLIVQNMRQDDSVLACWQESRFTDMSRGVLDAPCLNLVITDQAFEDIWSNRSACIDIAGVHGSILYYDRLAPFRTVIPNARPIGLGTMFQGEDVPYLVSFCWRPVFSAAVPQDRIRMLFDKVGIPPLPNRTRPHTYAFAARKLMLQTESATERIERTACEYWVDVSCLMSSIEQQDKKYFESGLLNLSRTLDELQALLGQLPQPPAIDGQAGITRSGAVAAVNSLIAYGHNLFDLTQKSGCKYPAENTPQQMSMLLDLVDAVHGDDAWGAVIS